ncbi:asparagine synthase (glutamine-hydrolyzing) [Hazenella sp. IB182353]|uniref:asparagine synthase (glutamine-hydrolyzing) n=1 Tax=Polycladospora coralii TaxID=2771432 RepID=UPI001747466C|nr:asparagine synthase (glutamine-hydrolyzing) [Polycladospora coralii]MBS7529192.1 asparagine synthase (glutamine-hydrolyzing) [Polycladospora coralii]
MCGFVSIYDRLGQPVNLDIIQKMTQTMIHRGPNEEGIILDGHLGLGFRRLSINGLKEGSQPFLNHNQSIAVVFNGEIYNYKELKKWLEELGYQFMTDTEAETLIHLYEEVGFDLPKYLRGMFAFQIWDREQDILFGARDQMGIKPMYWCETDHYYVFSSEIKGLLACPEVKRQVNQEALSHYLTFQYVPDPLTMFAGIYKIPPAHTWMVKNKEIKIQKYWEAQFQPDENRSFSDCVDETRAVIKESVHAHLMSEVPRGAFLSSGIDSSAIVALHRQHENVQTFTVGFDIPGYSELEFAKQTADTLKTNHHEVKIDATRYQEILPRLIWHQDEPVADPSAIALYFVSQLASQHVTVALSGEGADELFGGYLIYREPSALQMFSYLDSQTRKWLGSWASHLPNIKGKNYLLRGSKTVEERYFGNAFIFDEKMKKNLMTEELQQAYISPWTVTGPIYNRVPNADDVTKMQYLDIHSWLCGNILMKADKMSMANSLEVRTPFTDIRVFEVASRIPTKYKIANGTTKHVLREAMKEFLPTHVAQKKKLGFPVPIRYWLKNEFYQWAKDIIEESATSDFIRKSYALQLLEEHKHGHADHSRKIWTVLCFMLWHQVYIEEKYQFSTIEKGEVRRHHVILNLDGHQLLKKQGYSMRIANSMRSF